jgi:hypothetical protein
MNAQEVQPGEYLIRRTCHSYPQTGHQLCAHKAVLREVEEVKSAAQQAGYGVELGELTGGYCAAIHDTVYCVKGAIHSQTVIVTDPHAVTTSSPPLETQASGLPVLG